MNPPRKPKLLVLATTVPKALGDGTPSFVLDLAIEHSKTFEVLILTPFVPGSKTKEKICGVSIERFHYFWPARENLADGSILDNLKTGFSKKIQAPFLMSSFLIHHLIKVLTWRPQVIHAHWIIPGGIISRFTPWVPRLVTAHGADVYALNGKLMRALKRFSLYRAEVTVVSNDMKEHLSSHFRLEKVHVLPMGVRFPSQAELRKIPRQVIFVGRLVEKKGLGYLLDAVTGVDCNLLVVGDGPLKTSLEKIASRNVSFLGQLPKTAVHSQIAASEILVMPSVVSDNGDREGLPVVLLEAAALGTSVIATTVGGISDLVKLNESGILVPPRDSESLRLAISELLLRPEKRDRFSKTLRKLAEDFELEKVAEKYRLLLQKIIHSKPNLSALK